MAMLEQHSDWTHPRITQHVRDGKVVTVEYTLFNHDSGDLIEYRDDLIYLHGLDGEALPSLQESIEGMPVDACQEIILSAEHAYGQYDPELVVVEDREKLPEDIDSVGARVAGECADGKIMMFTVTHVENDKIILDGNHRLAGKQLRFEIRIRDIRDASHQEISESRAFRVDRDLPEPDNVLH